ncbi:MAG: hypothetical protein IJF49_05620 [Clostridia bacterium]|nr:hypothetical protein [Clostridia bacterium]
MKFTSFFRILTASCRFFSVLVLVLCIGALLFGSEDIVINPLTCMTLFPFSVCLSWGTIILKNDRHTYGLRLLQHFLLITAGVVLFVLLPAGTLSSGRSALVIISLYLLLYLIVMVIASLVRKALLRHAVESESYTAQYQHLREKK